MNTIEVADLTITIGTPEMIEGIDRTPYVATYPDGAWAATYWHPPLPNIPGRTRADWQTVQDFIDWLAWARS